MSKQKRKPNLTPEQQKLLQKFQNDTRDNTVPEMEKSSTPKTTKAIFLLIGLYFII